MRCPRLCLLAMMIVTSGSGSLCAEDDLFREKIAPLLQRRCLGCHNDAEHKGGLSFTSAKAAFEGGDSGSVIEPGKPDDSELLAQITPENGKAAMPKDADPLKPEDIELFRQWIAAGAQWPEGFQINDQVATQTDWWSFQPPKRPALPALPPDRAAWVRTPVDAFVAAKHVELGTKPAPEADRRTLIRRLSFDILGLPPTIEEVTAFQNDLDPRAYEKLVDRLLESPHYGERWARHWLDVVHYGETHGYDKDKPRPNAWPYRDYVIRSLNEDKPYARFVQEQLAGDVLFPDTRDGLEALGFIAAGPWDFIGHAEVPESKIDGKVARHLDRDDMVVNTIQTFCSLTIQCAQCHNHKFDPISQADYYSLQAVFAAVDRTDRQYDPDPLVAQKRRELIARQAALTIQRETIGKNLAERAGPRFKSLGERISQLQAARKNGPIPPEYGYHSGIVASPDMARWVQVELPDSGRVKKIVLHPCYDDFNNIGEGFGFPVRYQVAMSNDPGFQTGVTLIANETEQDVANPQLTPKSYEVDNTAKYVRITATKLAPRLPNDFIFSLAELEVWDAAGKNVARGAKVSALDSIEAAPRWRQANLVDGLYPGATRPNAAELADLIKERDELTSTHLTDAEKGQLQQLTQDTAGITQALGTLPPLQTAYIGAVHTGSGAFVGTGGNGGKPRPIHILKRGNVTQPGEEVGPGAITAVSGLSPRFTLPAYHSEGQRRAALANWITAPENPLTWRTIVNRVWHYHFGRGLVETPNDFGKNGQLPSHPELLDWLAVEFRDHGQSLKALHRLIVTSAVYRQSSLVAPETSPANDADNRSLWRMNRRRLEAEAVRDSILMISGSWNKTMYGPSFQDFVIEKPEHSPHYEYGLFDPHDPRCHRRSVYRFLVRSQPQPFMATLDCADPSMQVEKRNESLSALQALALLNNAFVTTMSEKYVQRLESQEGTLETRVQRAFHECLARDPSPKEAAALLELAKKHGLANCCRLLFNLNEFVFVD